MSAPWNDELVRRLPLEVVILETDNFALEHLPPLISDACLRDSLETVMTHLRAQLRRGRTVQAEIINMPRSHTGDRPVQYIDLGTRLAYTALTHLAADALEPPSRSSTTRRAFQSFGSQSGSSYTIVSDIAACYEYIVPEILIQEIAIRVDDYDMTRQLAMLLAELSTLGRGLPQMLQASDRLSDVYLSRVDRALERANLSWSRTADDFKILVDDWESAAGALELLEQEVRKLGLTLSAEKTRTVRSGPSAASRSSGATESELLSDGDDEEDEDNTREALSRWHDSWKVSKSRRAGVDPPSVIELQRLTSLEGLPKSFFSDLVFSHPPHLEYVVETLVRLGGKAEGEEGKILEAFDGLLQGEQKNAWKILWLLNGADRLQSLRPFKNRLGAEVLARQGLSHSSEAVRAESAWHLAKWHSLSPEAVRRLHRDCSGLTIAGVSAVASRARAGASGQSANEWRRLVDGVSARDALNLRAAAWASRQEVSHVSTE